MFAFIYVYSLHTVFSSCICVRNRVANEYSLLAKTFCGIRSARSAPNRVSDNYYIVMILLLPMSHDTSKTFAAVDRHADYARM